MPIGSPFFFDYEHCEIYRRCRQIHRRFLQRLYYSLGTAWMTNMERGIDINVGLSHINIYHTSPYSPLRSIQCPKLIPTQVQVIPYHLMTRPSPF
jgi:hypothetical protein